MLLASLVLCSETGATADSNPYQAIVTRNVFGLKDPPAPAPAVEQKKPVPKLTLTGITTLGKTRALMTAPPAPPKPGELPKGLQSFILGVGERDGEVEVVSIDPALGKVTVKLGGESVTIGFPDYSRSQAGSAGNSPASLANLSPTAQFAQVAPSVPTAEAQPGVMSGSVFPQTAGSDSPPAAGDNPYARRFNSLRPIRR
jgi:hypothetical protein